MCFIRFPLCLVFCVSSVFRGGERGLMTPLVCVLYSLSALFGALRLFDFSVGGERPEPPRVGVEGVWIRGDLVEAHGDMMASMKSPAISASIWGVRGRM